MGFLLLTLPTYGAPESAGSPKGLYVRTGTVMRGGKPYLGIGANYDTLFGRLLQNKDDTSSLENLGRLAKSGIPFVRFRACGFWPQNGRLYLNDPTEYYRRMDQVVRCAEKNDIGLIPSLFWRLATVSELMKEAPREVANPGSRSQAFIKRYTREMVLRYKDSPAIWGWEFGNEANLGVDMKPQPSGARGRAGRRNQNAFDDGGIRLTTAQLRTAYLAFAKTVRSLDPSRIIDTGTTIPRPAAWHNAHGEPGGPDSASHSYAMLQEYNPDPIDILSVHVYQKSQKLAPFGPESVNQFLQRYSQAAGRAGKPLFLGEFPVRTREQTEEYLRAIQENHIPLSAFWVFDNSRQEKTMDVSFKNDRAFVIGRIAQANRDLQRVR